MNLDDLQVIDRTPPRTTAAALIRYRQATLDDLIQVLEGMGAETVGARKHWRNNRVLWHLGVPEPGTYLVLKVDSDE